MNKKTTAKNILLLQKLVLLGLCVGIVIFLICISIYRPWKYNGLKTTVGYGLYGLLGVFIIGILFLYIIPAQKRLNAIGKG